MKDKKARVVAAQLLKVGTTKIFIEPGSSARLKEAMTKEDIRALIKEGVIRKRRENLLSRGRARKLKAKKQKGRKRGHGKRTGMRSARKSSKEKWINNVRAQRRTLREIKASGVKLKKPARQVYLMIKGNYFRGKKYIQTMVEEVAKK